MLLYVVFFLLLLHNICTNALTVAPEECQSRTLAPEEGFEGLETMDFDTDGANFNLYNIPIPSTHGEVSLPNTSLLEGQDIEIGPMDEECHPATTLGSQPLSS